MSKKLFVMLVVCSAVPLLLAACGTTGSDTSAAGNAVHMNDTNFVQASVMVKKGESLTLITDTLTPHILANGTWEHGTAKPTTESGAPEVKGMQINGYSSGTIGPFNTAGTFTFYCTIHQGMNLTVVVEG